MMDFDREKVREDFLRMCFHGRPWLHWAFGWSLGRLDSDHVRESVLELLSEMLSAGEVVAGTPKGWVTFDPWGLSPDETMERIRCRWSALNRPPGHGDIAAFTMTDECRASYVLSHPESTDEMTNRRSRRDKDMRSLFVEIRGLPNVVAEWPDYSEQDKEFDMYEWNMQCLSNMLLPLEWDYRDGLLTESQVEQYLLLKREFRESKLLLESLDRDYPEDVLEE